MVTSSPNDNSRHLEPESDFKQDTLLEECARLVKEIETLSVSGLTILEIIECKEACKPDEVHEFEQGLQDKLCDLSTRCIVLPPDKISQLVATVLSLKAAGFRVSLWANNREVSEKEYIQVYLLNNPQTSIFFSVSSSGVAFNREFIDMNKSQKVQFLYQSGWMEFATRDAESVDNETQFSFLGLARLLNKLYQRKLDRYLVLKKSLGNNILLSSSNYLMRSFTDQLSNTLRVCHSKTALKKHEPGQLCSYVYELYRHTVDTFAKIDSEIVYLSRLLAQLKEQKQTDQKRAEKIKSVKDQWGSKLQQEFDSHRIKGVLNHDEATSLGNALKNSAASRAGKKDVVLLNHESILRQFLQDIKFFPGAQLIPVSEYDDKVSNLAIRGPRLDVLVIFEDQKIVFGLDFTLGGEAVCREKLNRAYIYNPCVLRLPPQLSFPCSTIPVFICPVSLSSLDNLYHEAVQKGVIEGKDVGVFTPGFPPAFIYESIFAQIYGLLSLYRNEGIKSQLLRHNRHLDLGKEIEYLEELQAYLANIQQCNSRNLSLLEPSFNVRKYDIQKNIIDKLGELFVD